MASWTEVRELAAKLKSTQERECLQTLSERTWVDIVRHLMTINRVRLVFTSDGRSYLTKDELEKEIREEVEAHGGRVSLSEMASYLDVDQTVVESTVVEMISFDSLTKVPDRLIGIPGEVVSDSYLRKIAHDIRDRLEQRGQTTVWELTTSFSLPTPFIVNILQQYQGVLFHLHKYGEEYVTDAYLSFNKAKARGYFMPLLRPVSVTFAASRLQMPESLLSNIVMTLINDGQLYGTLAVGRNTYIPSCYTSAENAYIQSFYNQNGYVEWEHLKRLGVAGSSQHRSLLSDAVHLSSVSVGPTILNQLNATIEEAAHEDSWVDLTHCFPPGVIPKDRLTLITPALGKFPMNSIDNGLYLVPDGFLLKCSSCFDKLLHIRAEMAIKDRSVVPSINHQQKLDQDSHTRQTSHNIKGGFGMGAREFKTKNVKRKYAVGKRKTQAISEADDHSERGGTPDYESDTVESVFSRHVTDEELFDLLTSELPSDVPPAVISGVIELIRPQLARSFSKLLNSIFLPNSDTALNREMIHETQEAASNILLSIQLIERGINAIDRPNLQKQLLCHLIKTQGTCLVDRLCVHLAQYYGLRWPSNSGSNFGKLEFVNPMTNDQRDQLLDLLRKAGPADATGAAVALNGLLEKLRSLKISDTIMVDYYSHLSTLASDHLGLCLPISQGHVDNRRKKEERNKANELALQMELQLEQAFQRFQISSDIKEAAVATLAAACLFSQVVTGWPITAPGKLVPQLVDWLSEVKAQKTGRAGTNASHAFDIFVTSNVSDCLSLLTMRISQNMHSNATLSAGSDVDEALIAVVETAKACRKTLYT